MACPAEQLGVELPRGGAQAISQEDLRRDAWLLQREAEPGAAAAVVGQRLGQMRLLPGFGGDWVRREDHGLAACGRKDGAGQRVLLVIATGDPASAAGALDWAGLVSLAKGWDLPGVPPRSRLLCVTTEAAATEALLAAPPVPAAQLGAVVRLGALHGGEPTLSGPVGQPPTWTLGTPAAPPEALGAVDYRQVEAAVRQALALLDALPG